MVGCASICTFWGLGCLAACGLAEGGTHHLSSVRAGAALSVGYCSVA
jgi:hypothetical protein